jgi:citrate/tricarballylate utilization protein
VIALLLAGSVAVFILGFVPLANPAALWSSHAGDFYKVMPHRAMVALFGAVTLYVIAAFVFSMRAFWRDIAGDALAGTASFWRAIGDSARLRYLGGGGEGCTSEDEKPSTQRRLYHHLTFYGFMLCFAATCVATIYHYAFGWHAPYPVLSLPVLLGIFGGLGLLVGPAGLFVLASERDAVLTDVARTGMDTAFIVMLALTSLTGFLLLIFRATPAMGILLAVHLGVVLALFLSLPYGKFVHGLYRFLALVKYAAERRAGKFVE